jgi:hypothetical protein
MLRVRRSRWPSSPAWRALTTKFPTQKAYGDNRPPLSPTDWVPRVIAQVVQIIDSSRLLFLSCTESAEEPV